MGYAPTMDPMIRWSIRLAQWFRHPPSRQMVMIGVVAISSALIIVGVERIWGWPTWLTMGDQPPRIIRQ